MMEKSSHVPSAPRPGVSLCPVPIARSTMTVDDDRLRVVSLTFADGDETGDHRHSYDYLVVPVTGGTFRVIERDGSTRDLVQEAGVPYLGKVGTEHNVINASGRAATFVEIELKR
jgi:beta-alanine degradation protein BauB